MSRRKPTTVRATPIRPHSSTFISAIRCSTAASAEVSTPSAPASVRPSTARSGTAGGRPGPGSDQLARLDLLRGRRLAGRSPLGGVRRHGQQVDHHGGDQGCTGVELEGSRVLLRPTRGRPVHGIQLRRRRAELVGQLGDVLGEPGSGVGPVESTHLDQPRSTFSQTRTRTQTRRGRTNSDRQSPSTAAAIDPSTIATPGVSLKLQLHPASDSRSSRSCPARRAACRLVPGFSSTRSGSPLASFSWVSPAVSRE